MHLKKIHLILTSCLIGLCLQANASTINVLQFNLHNAVFSDPNCLSQDNCPARQEALLMNQGNYDLIMTEENSNPQQQPRNLLEGYGLDNIKYALCGVIQDASIFYNPNRWDCTVIYQFNVTSNTAVPGNDGTRQVTVGLLIPKNPAVDPTILAAASHWCVRWGKGYSVCVGNDPVQAHANDAKTVAKKLDALASIYSNAIVIFAGDLNSKTPQDSDKIVADMKLLGYETANPYDAAKKLLFTRQDADTPGHTPDLIFYKPSPMLKLDNSSINKMNGLSDHSGVVAVFSYTHSQ